MDTRRLQLLTDLARDIRIDTLSMFFRAGYGHIGGSFSIVELLTILYFSQMRINPDQPDWAERDRFILSKGHACTSYYATLARRGYFDPGHLDTYAEVDSILPGHPDMLKTPGVDFNSGSLGQGLSAGIGMALAARLSHRTYRTYVMLGDGEIQEGQIWEAAMAATGFGLDNLTAIVDYNKLQLTGSVNRTEPLEPLADKWRAFGWHVIQTDGHQFPAITEALAEMATVRECPTVIIAHTVKGKGVSFMENEKSWHSHALDAAQYESALRELKGGA